MRKPKWVIEGSREAKPKFSLCFKHSFHTPRPLLGHSKISSPFIPSTTLYRDVIKLTFCCFYRFDNAKLFRVSRELFSIILQFVSSRSSFCDWVIGSISLLPLGFDPLVIVPARRHRFRRWKWHLRFLRLLRFLAEPFRVGTWDISLAVISGNIIWWRKRAIKGRGQHQLKVTS